MYKSDTGINIFPFLRVVQGGGGDYDTVHEWKKAGIMDHGYKRFFFPLSQNIGT